MDESHTQYGYLLDLRKIGDPVQRREAIWSVLSIQGVQPQEGHVQLEALATLSDQNVPHVVMVTFPGVNLVTLIKNTAIELTFGRYNAERRYQELTKLVA